MSYEQPEFDTFIRDHSLGHPKNKYYLDIRKLALLAHGTIDSLTKKLHATSSNVTYNKCVIRMNALSIYDSDRPYIHIDNAIIILRNQPNIKDSRITEFMEIAKTIEGRLYKQVPQYIDKTFVKSDTQIMNVLSNNLLSDDINTRVDEHIRKCEEHINELRGLMKLVNDNMNLKNNYMFTRLLEIGSEKITTKKDYVCGYLVESNNLMDLIEELFGDRLTDELISMIDMCIEDDELMFIRIGESEIINGIKQHYHVKKIIPAVSNFTNCVIALIGTDPITIDFKIRKINEWCLIPIDKNTAIVSAGEGILTSAIGKHSNPRKFEL